jgi:two-component system, OmpR family, sensor kinase
MRRSRPRRTRLRTRVLLGVLSVTLITFAAFDIVAVAELRQYLVSHTDSTLQTVLGVGRARLGRLLPRVESRKQPFQPQGNLGEYYLAFVSGHGSTAILQASPDLAPRLPADLASIAAGQRSETVTGLDGRGQFRLRAMQAGGGILVVSTSLDEVDRTVGRLQLIVTIGSAAAAAAISLGVAFVVRRGLRPLETMATQADRITAGDLTGGAAISPQDAAT